MVEQQRGFFASSSSWEVSSFGYSHWQSPNGSRKGRELLMWSKEVGPQGREQVEKSGKWIWVSRRMLLLLLLLSRFSRVRLCVTPETTAHLAPPPLGFSSMERSCHLGVGMDFWSFEERRCDVIV
ncbi:uncharacterized protein [Ovis canadensis]|uniref:uncharacterized protein isoform X5 n=1 Tax=Ovis canadensis TaxID=37174 RepID=UPI003753D3F9